MAASTRTRTLYAQDVLQLLAEAANATQAALPTGAGTNALTITQADGINALINVAKDRICRYALLVSVAGTKTLAVGDGSTFLWTSLTFSSVKTVRIARSVAFDPTGIGAGQGNYTLAKISAACLANWYADRDNGANANPRYFANTEDKTGISLQAKTALAGVLSAACYVIPSDMASDGAAFTWLDSADEPAVPLEVAVMLAEKRRDDPRMPAIRAYLAPRLDAIIAGIRSRYSATLAKEYLEPYVPLSTTETG